MRIFKKILIGLAVLMVVFVAVGFLLPSSVLVSRSTVMAATPDKIFPYMNDLKKFQSWSPWAGVDPTMKLTFSGPEKGKGQKVSWDSEKMGKGSQTISDAEENRRVTTVLDFGQMGMANAIFKLEPEGSGTKVTWDFTTELGNNPLGRWMGLMMDNWVGSDFAKGLAKLKKIVEAG